MKIGFMSYFDTCSGYGNSAVQICRSMHRYGHTVIPYAYTIDVDLPRDFTDLFTQKEPEKLDAIIVFALPNQLRLTDKMAKRIPIKIGYSMWEQTRFSKDLMVKNKPYENFTELWVPCKMNVEPFHEFSPSKNIEVMPLGINGDYFKFKDWQENRNGRPFRFCMNGALGYRKGTFLVINAFREIRKEHPEWNIELHLKTSTKGMVKQMESWTPGLHIYNEMYWPDEMLDFYHKMDCMVAPSRGEGFHQPPLELTATGGIVITTTWGGMEEWFDPIWAYRVDHELVEIGNKWPSSRKGSMWAEPVPASIKVQMEYVYLHQDEAFARARIGHEIVNTKFNWEIVVLKMLNRLEVLHGKEKHSRS